MLSYAWPAILEDSEDSSRGVATQIQEEFRDASESQGVECIGQNLKVTLAIPEEKLVNACICMAYVASFSSLEAFRINARLSYLIIPQQLLIHLTVVQEVEKPDTHIQS